MADTTAWLSLIPSLDQATLESRIPRKNVPQLVKGASDAINNLQHQEAVNHIALGLYLYPKRMTDEIRRSGLFRSSKYKFRPGYFRPVLSGVLAKKTTLKLSQEIVEYFQSILDLSATARDVFIIHASILKFIAKRQSVFFKTVMALTDSLFLTEHSADISLCTDRWKHYSKEELAEAASYLIHCFDNEIGIKDQHFNLLDEEALLLGRYHSILVKACKVRRFLEAEILIDAFGYQCHRGKRSLRIRAPHPELEMSIRLGYIQEELSRVRTSMRKQRAIRDGELSIFQLADEFFDRFHDRIVKVVDDPIRRCVFVLPEIAELIKIFRQEGLFVEERLFLDDILDSEMSKWEELRHFEIGDDLSILDLLKVNRLFSFSRHLARRHLEPLLEEDPRLVYRSLIPVFENSRFGDLLRWSLPPAKIDSMIRLLSWEPGASGLLDLQYKPLVRCSNHVLAPLNLSGTSNWYRNLAHTEKKRVIGSVEEEAASRALAEVFGHVCQYVRKTFNTKLEGEEIEIDVIARFGDILFVFECKHPLLPCNLHELRTSYDHMKKGAATLTRIAELITKPGLENQLYQRLGWKLDPAERIVTCIVSCNGMFPGMSMEGHPIRRWAELKNMIEFGTIVVSRDVPENEFNDSSGQDEHLLELSLWEGSKLTPELLRRYICENLLLAPTFQAMIEWDRSYRIGRSKLTFSTFLLDASALRKNLIALFSSPVPPTA